MPGRDQCTMPARAEIREHPSGRCLGLGKQPLPTVAKGSCWIWLCCRWWEAVWLGSRRPRSRGSRAGSGDIVKKLYLIFALRPEFQNGHVGHWALQSDLPSAYSPANLCFFCLQLIVQGSPTVSSVPLLLPASAAGMSVQAPLLHQLALIGLVMKSFPAWSLSPSCLLDQCQMSLPDTQFWSRYYLTHLS